MKQATMERGPAPDMNPSSRSPGLEPPKYTQRGPWRITFDTNPDDCNLACIMCEEHSRHQRLVKKHNERSGAKRERRVMDFKIIEQVVREASQAGLREIIPSTMGEPLLYGHFDRILDICRATGVSLNLTTNGTFPRKTPAEWGRLIFPVGSDVKISWNGATRETSDAIMEGSHFEKRCNALEHFIACRDAVHEETGHYCSISFQLTFLERNFAEIPAIIALAAHVGVDRVKGHHLWVHHQGMAGQSLRRDKDSIHRWNSFVKTLPNIVDQHRRPDGSQVRLENFFSLAEDTGTRVNSGYECPFLGQEAWVAWDGTFNPCCAPDQLRQSLGDFGKVSSKGLMEIWENPIYQDLMANYKQFPVCQNCNMRRPPTQICPGNQVPEKHPKSS